MTDSGLPQDVEDFLDDNIFSVTQLEVLLLARESGEQGATADRLSAMVHVPRGSLVPWLDAFVERGLLDRDAEGRYAAAPVDPELDRTLVAVADTYARRRVTLSRHVYARAGDPARRFADAFRFRREPDKDRGQ